MMVVIELDDDMATRMLALMQEGLIRVGGDQTKPLHEKLEAFRIAEEINGAVHNIVYPQLDAAHRKTVLSNVQATKA